MIQNVFDVEIEEASTSPISNIRTAILRVVKVGL